MIVDFKGIHPKVEPTASTAENAIVMGDLEMGQRLISGSFDEKNLDMIRNTLSDYQSLKKIYHYK